MASQRATRDYLTSGVYRGRGPSPNPRAEDRSATSSRRRHLRQRSSGDTASASASPAAAASVDSPGGCSAASAAVAARGGGIDPFLGSLPATLIGGGLLGFFGLGLGLLDDVVDLFGGKPAHLHQAHPAR